jgi:muramoyltetrapeptide carboxypeptidase LdcA involved in peptidoglycan recycling
MGLYEKDERSRNWLRKILFGESNLELGSESNWISIIQGEVTGNLLVSNLDSLVTLLGTRYDPLMHGSGDLILGIEEWWIEKSTLQRQIDTILNHKRANRIKGIILGRFVGVGEYSYPIWGKDITAADLIEGRVRLRGGMPMAQLMDFGHPVEGTWLQQKFPQLMKPQTFLSLPNCIECKLSVESGGASLKFLETIAG